MISNLRNVLILVVLIFFLTVWFRFRTVEPQRSPAPHSDAPESTPVVLIGAGDISVCGLGGDDQTGLLIERLLLQYPDAVVFTTGDNAQSMGLLYEYTDCFEPAWGSFLDRIHPSPGNHDWLTEQGRDYFAYFGAAAGEPGLGYYSYDVGSWHIVSLNSNCDQMDCGEASLQVQWLRNDLEQHADHCTLLYWHHPLWDSGTVPISPSGKAFWRAASDYGAEVVVNGHDHHYERFVPLDANGRPSPGPGTRAFLVGTGGAWLFDLGSTLPITEVRNNATHGVILFFLYPDRYEWHFLPVYDGSFYDSGSDSCYTVT